MRPNIRAFLEVCAETLPSSGPVLEVGSFQVPGQAELIDLRSLFPGLEFVGTDMRDGPGVDRVEDVMDLTFPDDVFGTVVLADTLEHVENPERAIQEVRRVCLPDGIVIATSVMDFPIHGHPSDYWRFTPESFRRLARDFASVATFSSGPEDYPHTVAIVASPQGTPVDVLRELAARLEELDVPQPPAVGSETRRLLHLLSRQVLASRPEATTEQSEGQDQVVLDWPHDRPAWTLVDGSWISGTLSEDPGAPIVVSAGEQVLGRFPLSPTPEGRWTFRGQARTTGSDHVGALVIQRGTDGPLLHTTPPGVVIGALHRHAAFRLHSLDERSDAPTGDDERNRGALLVDRLRTAGEPVAVDLGCGFRKNGTVGIDVTRDGTDADLVCRAGFDPIPLPSGSVDSVFCRDFLEHIPKAVWRDDTLQYPVIDLMNEIWRIMKPGAEFLSLTPGYPKPEVHQDPTHVSVWVENSFGYFTGKYPVARAYGVRCEFEQVELGWEGFYIRAVLRKPAGVPG